MGIHVFFAKILVHEHVVVKGFLLGDGEAFKMTGPTKNP